jgi:hypothetical protein
VTRRKRNRDRRALALDSDGRGVQKQTTQERLFWSVAHEAKVGCACALPHFPTRPPCRHSTLTTASAPLAPSRLLTSPHSSLPPPIHSPRIEHGNGMAGQGTSSEGGAGDGGSNGEEVQIQIAGPYLSLPPLCTFTNVNVCLVITGGVERRPRSSADSRICFTDSAWVVLRMCSSMSRWPVVDAGSAAL